MDSVQPLLGGGQDVGHQGHSLPGAGQLDDVTLQVHGTLLLLLQVPQRALQAADLVLQLSLGGQRGGDLALQGVNGWSDQGQETLRQGVSGGVLPRVKVLQSSLTIHEKYDRPTSVLSSREVAVELVSAIINQ